MDAPTLLKPDNTANLPLKKAAKFTWQKVTDATKYRLIFSNDKSFANYDANKFKCLNAKTCFMYTVASPSYNVVATHAMLKTDGDYFWQAQSVGKKTVDNSKKGEIREFRVGTSISKITSYTKIANNGSTLSDDAKLGTTPTDWACTKDNKTGLIWEVKTDDGGVHDASVGYNSKFGISLAFEYGANQAVTDANNSNFCGADNWRLPELSELSSLAEYTKSGSAMSSSCVNGRCTSQESAYYSPSMSVDEKFFPNFGWGASFTSSYSAFYLAGSVSLNNGIPEVLGVQLVRTMK
ncbi:MAG: DUF1566 domain-containing protein [Methylococcaceae bacterium]